MRASGYDRVVDDWYVEPASVVEALLAVETFDGICWDPACGGGNIPTVLRGRDIECLASDIADRGFGIVCHDFFSSPVLSDHIVSNPPYGVLQAFVERALSKATGKVAILARLAFLEGQARRQFFASTPLARVWVSSRRLSMPPGGTDIPAKGGTIAFAWFVWDHAHTGSPTIGWLP